MYSVLFSVNSLHKTQSEIISLIGELCEKQWRNIEYAKPRDDEAYKNRFKRQSFDKISIYMNDYLTNMIYETGLYWSDIELLDIVDDMNKILQITKEYQFSTYIKKVLNILKL